MKIHTITAAVAAAVAVIALGTQPLTAQAVTSGSSYAYHYTTYITTRTDPIGWAGTLVFNISPSGIVSGYYRADAGTGTPQSVTGGRSGNTIWFDIGTSGQLHVTGSMKGDKIAGVAWSRHTVESDIFTATLSPTL